MKYDVDINIVYNLKSTGTLHLLILIAFKVTW